MFRGKGVAAIASLVLVIGLGFSRDICQEPLTPPRPFEEVLGMRGAPVAYISGVETGSVAESLGFSPGDLIVGFNGETMREVGNFRAFLTELRIAALLNSATINILKYDQESESYSPQQRTGVLRPQSDDPTEQYLGLGCTFTYLVQEVFPNTLAERMGVRPGDFIQEINGRRIGNLDGPLTVDRIVRDISASTDREVRLSLLHWYPLPEGGKKSDRIRTVVGNLN